MTRDDATRTSAGGLAPAARSVGWLISSGSIDDRRFELGTVLEGRDRVLDLRASLVPKRLVSVE
jgi:hypothetical protein